MSHAHDWLMMYLEGALHDDPSGFLERSVDRALAGDPYLAKALMQILAYLHREALPVPPALRYYLHEACRRVVVDGQSADAAFGLQAGRGKPHPFARTERYADLIVRVDRLRAEGHKDYMVWEIIATEGLLALDGTDRREPATASTARKEYRAAEAFFEKVAKQTPP